MRRFAVGLFVVIVVVLVLVGCSGLGEVIATYRATLVDIRPMPSSSMVLTYWSDGHVFNVSDIWLRDMQIGKTYDVVVNQAAGGYFFSKLGEVK